MHYRFEQVSMLRIMGAGFLTVGKGRGREEGWNEPCGVGLGMEVSVWTRRAVGGSDCDAPARQNREL